MIHARRRDKERDNINSNQIELIQTAAEYMPLHDDWVDKAGSFIIHYHHFSYLIHSDEEWGQLRGKMKADGRPLVMDVETEMLTVTYVGAPELGHFLEYVFPNEAGKAFF